MDQVVATWVTIISGIVGVLVILWGGINKFTTSVSEGIKNFLGEFAEASAKTLQSSDKSHAEMIALINGETKERQSLARRVVDLEEGQNDMRELMKEYQEDSRVQSEKTDRMSERIDEIYKFLIEDKKRG